MIQTEVSTWSRKKARNLISATCSRPKHVRIGVQTLLVALLCGYSCTRVEATSEEAVASAPQNLAEQEKSCAALLEAGNARYESGDLHSAEEEWIKVINCQRTAPTWPKAVFNLGQLEMKRRNFSRAVKYFEQVLQSHPNDEEPGANIMQVYRNYSYRSALQISRSYEEMGDIRSALGYAWLARTRYPYRSWCGTCLESENRSLDQRIGYLSARAHGIYVLGVLLIAGSGILWWKTG